MKSNEGFTLNAFLEKVPEKAPKTSAYRKLLSSYVSSGVNLKESRMFFRLSSKIKISEARSAFPENVVKIELIEEKTGKTCYSHSYVENKTCSLPDISEPSVAPKINTGKAPEPVKGEKEEVKEEPREKAEAAKAPLKKESSKTNVENGEKALGTAKAISNILTNKNSPYDENTSIRILKRELYRLARYNNDKEFENYLLSVIKDINSEYIRKSKPNSVKKPIKNNSDV